MFEQQFDVREMYYRLINLCLHPGITSPFTENNKEKLISPFVQHERHYLNNPAIYVCAHPKLGPRFPTSYFLSFILCSLGKRLLFLLLVLVQLLTVTVGIEHQITKYMMLDIDVLAWDSQTHCLVKPIISLKQYVKLPSR